MSRPRVPCGVPGHRGRVAAPAVARPDAAAVTCRRAADPFAPGRGIRGGRALAPAAWAAAVRGVSAASTSTTPPARRMPAVGRALQLYAGLVKQMPMEAYRGYDRLPQPRLLAKPDPLRGGPEFVGLSIEDYLLSGNAVARVTVRDVEGWPPPCNGYRPNGFTLRGHRVNRCRRITTSTTVAV